MAYAFLHERGLIGLSGEDAREFLQGLVSNDIRRLQEGGAVYAALLSPQGKFLHDFFIALRGGIFFLDVDKVHLPNLMQRLNLYKLRSKVTIAEEKNSAVAAIWDAEFSIKNSEFSFPDPRLRQLGYRIMGNAEVIEQRCQAQHLQAGDYDRMRLELGVPDGARDMVADKSLLLEFGFEDLHGVDFNKGCYVGQEVTARSKHRAQLRKFIYQVKAHETLPPAGTPVFLGETEIGQMRSSSENIGLALLKLADVEMAEKSNKELYAGAISLKATLPQWVIHRPAAE